MFLHIVATAFLPAVKIQGRQDENEEGGSGQQAFEHFSSFDPVGFEPVIHCDHQYAADVNRKAYQEHGVKSPGKAKVQEAEEDLRQRQQHQEQHIKNPHMKAGNQNHASMRIRVRNSVRALES